MCVKIFVKDNCPKCPMAKKLFEDLKAQNVDAASYNVETAEGLGEASFYQVMSTPSVIVEGPGEQLVGLWRGSVPKIEEVMQLVSG